MSELQTALLVIGVGMVIAVYGFGWWQQRKYRRKFGSAFKADHDDALYHAPVEQAQKAMAEQTPVDAIPMKDAPAIQFSGGAPDETAPASGRNGERKSGAEGLNIGERPMHFLNLDDAVPVAEFTALPDKSCTLLSTRSDFIIELHPVEPSPAAVLDGLWQRKFDFGKPLQVCGLTLAGQRWERVIAESQSLYSHFRIALQLVDRSGAVSATKLADLRDLVLGVARHIKADTAVPDVHEAHCRATELDAFCVEVDQIVGINLIPPGERMLQGARIAQTAALQGLVLEADGAFHLLDMNGHSIFALINQDSKPFSHHNLETFKTTGITLLLDVPRVEHPTAQFDRMVLIAHGLARELQVNMVDDNRVVLSENGLARIYEQIARVEEKMSSYGIVPGSAQAHRLFS